MTITIIRNTGWQGAASNMKIKVNNKKFASIGYNQRLDIDLPLEKAKLRVSQLGVKSNEITVKKGDTLELTPTRWYRMNFPLFVAILILSNFIPGLNGPIIGFVLVLLLSISLFLVDGFNLRVIDSKD